MKLFSLQRRKKVSFVNSTSSTRGLIRRKDFHKARNQIITTFIGTESHYLTNRSLDYVTSARYSSTSDSRKIDKRYIGFILFAGLLLFIGVTLISVSVENISSASRNLSSNISRSCDGNTQIKATKDHELLCGLSDEAKRVKLREFLLKVRDENFKLFPEQIARHPEVTVKMIREKYKVHNPRPENIKRIWDTANQLLQEARILSPNLSLLKPREHKAYLQVIHFLENTFGHQYMNYNSGLWMMTPGSFCTDPVCYLSVGIFNTIGRMFPRNESEVQAVERHLESVQVYINDYIDVLKMGIHKGMVRTKAECMSSLSTLKSKFSKISRYGPKGIKKEWFAKRFYKKAFYGKIPKSLDASFAKKQGKKVKDHIQSLLESTIGSSIDKLLRYLEFDHMLYCRPNNVGPGGLSALPLEYIYYNGTITSNKTDPYLPNCEGNNCRLNGSEAYRYILGYFTTKDISPEEVYRVGMENLERYYPQMVEIAKQVTNISDNESLAIHMFQDRLKNRSLNYFNDKPFPGNETGERAHKMCNNEENAKIYCPTRWKAMTKWFSFSRKVLSLLEPQIVKYFHFTGNEKFTPSCPIDLKPDFNPSTGAQTFWPSGDRCKKPCYYKIPFFLDDLGPNYAEYSVNSHEARPGHHTQVQGLAEHFRDKCGGPEEWLDDKTYYTAFTEGWALYAENPLIAQGTNIYDDNPMQRFGMLRSQVWRALRLIVDTGLHYRGMSRAEALKYFERYAWDKTDLSKKEVTRYQSNYGQATAYMIGQLDIWKLRNMTEEMLGRKYDIREFHLQALSQGSSPLAYLRNYIEKYIECKKHPENLYCDIVLNPIKATSNKRTDTSHTNFKWVEHVLYW